MSQHKNISQRCKSSQNASLTISKGAVKNSAIAKRIQKKKGIQPEGFNRFEAIVERLVK